MLLAGVLLLLFAAVKLLVLYAWQQSRRQAEPVALACDVRKSCVLFGGVMLKFSRQPTAHVPFDIEVSGLEAGVRDVYVSFSMKNMDMGFNRYDLKKEADGVWRAENVRLPVCSEGRHDYLADVHIDKRIFQTGFSVH